MRYQHMKFDQLLKELNSEVKARMWGWFAKFDGREFVCPRCHHEDLLSAQEKPHHDPESLFFRALEAYVLQYLEQNIDLSDKHL